MNCNNNYNELWINKYSPKSIDDVVGNINEINNIKKWLKNLNNNKNQSIIISGNQGLGKTLIIKLILEELNYIIKIINPNEIKDHRIYDDFNDYYNFVNSIYSKINFNNNINKKLVLVFDETENITLTSEKKYIMEIYKENNKNKSFPLIFISNNRHSKLLYDLKKGCTEIIFNNPTIDELKKLINKICLNENIIINSEGVYNKLIAFSLYDIRRLINLLQELSYHIDNDNILSENIINEFIIKSREKNIDIGLFEATSTILNNNLDYDSIIKMYESEKVLLPLMIHENYLKKILYKSPNNISTIINNLVNISDSISLGDNIETSIYTDQNWYLQNIHGYYTCINTSYWINKNNYHDIKIDEIKFSSDLNKTSLRNINRKNINNLIKIINNKSIEEILILNKICNFIINKEMINDDKKNKNKLICDKNFSNLIKILNSYNKKITIKDIELCLKIDKTSDFNILSTKDKKRIIKQIVL